MSSQTNERLGYRWVRTVVFGLLSCSVLGLVAMEFASSYQAGEVYRAGMNAWMSITLVSMAAITSLSDSNKCADLVRAFGQVVKKRPK
ncbi:MAG: hypothetical protein IH985_01680 [Planctomycetes bacterium]|nr:hypothetical protein [Planctomycetota bacterium]